MELSPQESKLDVYTELKLQENLAFRCTHRKTLYIIVMNWKQCKPLYNFLGEVCGNTMWIPLFSLVKVLKEPMVNDSTFRLACSNCLQDNTGLDDWHNQNQISTWFYTKPVIAVLPHATFKILDRVMEVDNVLQISKLDKFHESFPSGYVTDHSNGDHT